MHKAGHRPRAFIIFAGTASEPDKFFRRRWESDVRRNGDLWMLKYIVVTSALLVGSTCAYAAEMDRGDRGAAGGAGNMSNSASDQAPGQMKGGGSASDLAPGHAKPEGRSARDNAPGQEKGSSASRSGDKSYEHRAGSSDRLNKNDRNAKGEGSENKNERNAKGEGLKNKNERNANADRDRKVDQSRADERKGNAGTGASEGTEGRSGPRGSIASVSPEQKTRITTIFSHHHVAPVRDLNVAVNVGVVIPRSVHVYPVPMDIVTIVPDYRGYMYFMIDDNRVAIVDPDTYEVVEVIVIA
jgi:hypothetical protein